MKSPPSNPEDTPGLDQLCARALDKPAAEPAIEFRGQWISWGDIRQVATGLGRLLDEAGAGTHPTIAFAARNRPSALAAFLGMLAKSCSVRMLYPFQSPAALAGELARIQPAVMVADAEDYAGPVTAALRQQGAAAISLSGMHAMPVPGLERTRHAGSAGDTPRIEILTSGTTGPPKPFPLDYGMIARHIAGAVVGPQVQSADGAVPAPALLMFPVSNISGLYSTLPPLIAGQPVVLLEKFTVEGWHDYVLRFRPAATGMPPAGIQMLLDADIPPGDLACLRGIGTGAAPLDPEVHRAFERRYGVPILLSYGATELGGPVTRVTPELHAEWGERKFGSVGRALPGVQLRVVDPDTGVGRPPGTEGILEVVSPRIGADWIRTTDIAVLDEDGFLFLRGRADSAIMRGGFKVLPATVEHALLLDPAISAAAVVGVADRRLGQVPAAAVQLKPGVEAPGIDAIEARLREHVPATHIPVAWRLLPALPRTPSMKVDMPAIRRLFEEPVPD